MVAPGILKGARVLSGIVDERRERQYGPLTRPTRSYACKRLRLRVPARLIKVQKARRNLYSRGVRRAEQQGMTFTSNQYIHTFSAYSNSVIIIQPRHTILAKAQKADASIATRTYG